MAVLAPQTPFQSIGETRNHAVSFVGKLDEGELLTGTPTVTEIDTSVLVITNETVNSSALTINGAAVQIGEAVQFKVADDGSPQMTEGLVYRIKVTCATDGGQVVNGEINIIATA